MTAPVPPFPVAALVGIQQAGERAGWDEGRVTRHRDPYPCSHAYLHYDDEEGNTRCDECEHIVQLPAQPDTEPEDNE